MANVQINEGGWYDLGKFISKKCENINNKKVCQINFKDGKITILEEELDKING